MRRRFTFDDGVLACGAPSREDSEDSEQKKKYLPPGGNFPDAATRVERVVLLGADAGTYASEAEVRVFSKSTDGVSERTFAVDVERAPTSERGGEAVAPPRASPTSPSPTTGASVFFYSERRERGALVREPRRSRDGLDAASGTRSSLAWGDEMALFVVAL